MLTAVENHFGPARPYPTPHYGAVPNLLAPCPMTPLPTLNSAAAAVAMSAAEFVRPHPKTAGRYNNGPSIRGCNGISSPRSKYSSVEQNGPVNLAVSPHQTSSSPDMRQKSPQSAFTDPVTSSTQSQQSQSEQDAIHRSIASLYGPPKLPYCPTVSAGVNGQNVAAAYQLSFSNLYSRAANVYGSSALYAPPHPLTSSIHHSRPTYIPSHVDPYSAYLPPPHSSAVLSPQAPIVIAPASAAVAISQKNSLISTKLDGHDRLSMSQSGDHQPSINHKESKSSNQISASGKSNGFKVPSGKEGSLKHRILTRPYGEKEGAAKQKSATNVTNSIATCPTSIVKSSWSNNNNTNGNSHVGTNFTRGSLIELANGELKRVEDMRAEDFISSSSKNPSLQLADTTVVKLSAIPDNKVVITFIYNNNTFDIESTAGHPYFVYGKGWASYNPDSSMTLFRLKCQLLEVGDICISLTPRGGVPKSNPRPFAQQPKSQYYAQPELHTAPVDSRFGVQLPQNLSRKSQTIPTTATATAVCSRPVTTYDFNQQHPHYPQYLNGRNGSSVALQRNHSMEASTPKFNVPAVPNVNHNESRSLSPDADGAIDATTLSSRKRRWSAPENICDVDGCQSDSKKCTLH